MAEDMAFRLKWFKNLLPKLESSLKSFQTSTAKFQVLKTIYQEHSQPRDPIPSPQESPKTLFILDSSFNPPTVAHQYLVRRVLERSNTSQYATPIRLLLLFAVTNADKAPSPASFEQRLTMMSIFAKDLLDSLAEDSTQEFDAVPVDIGVTTAPYYTDKSAAIGSDGSQWYPEDPKHVHLIGFDTLTRFFAAKYYQKFDPPLSALNPYFDNGHKLRVTLRPDDEYGTVEQQRAFHETLESGEMEKDGGKKEWAEQVELVPPNPKTGVSSTKIRKAASSSDWNMVGELCTPGVVQWIKSEKLYAEDSKAAETV